MTSWFYFKSSWCRDSRSTFVHNTFAQKRAENSTKSNPRPHFRDARTVGGILSMFVGSVREAWSRVERVELSHLESNTEKSPNDENLVNIANVSQGSFVRLFGPCVVGEAYDFCSPTGDGCTLGDVRDECCLLLHTTTTVHWQLLLCPHTIFCLGFCCLARPMPPPLLCLMYPTSSGLSFTARTAVDTPVMSLCPVLLSLLGSSALQQASLRPPCICRRSLYQAHTDRSSWELRSRLFFVQ